MPRTVVISQPMFLPWIGLFEQVRLADIFFHYDDVQLPQGRSFMARVQVKTANGVIWLTAPLDRNRSGRLINEVVLSTEEDWRAKHLKTIQHAYARAPFFESMYDLVKQIYSHPTNSLAEFNINATEAIARWLGFTPEFRRTSESGIGGSSTQRLVDLCASASADTYVTGLGALKYLEHERFEERGITVRYMDYKLTPYPQQHGEFTPYVSIIDAIANVGERARDLVASPAVHWREMVKRDR
jgi:WbqC-like protein